MTTKVFTHVHRCTLVSVEKEDTQASEHCLDLIAYTVEVPKKLKLGLPCDPALPLLGAYPEKTVSLKCTCTPMFQATLYYYSAIKNSEIMHL